jgi:Na+/H+-dicarboxylate symporter
VLLGVYDPATAVKMDMLGKGFIQVVKIFINPIIFLTITLGISGMGDLRKVGQTGGKALIYFEVVTTFALLILLFKILASSILITIFFLLKIATPEALLTSGKFG